MQFFTEVNFVVLHEPLVMDLFIYFFFYMVKICSCFGELGSGFSCYLPAL